MKMNSRVRLLKQLVSDGMYVIDDVAVAVAVLLRFERQAKTPQIAGVPVPVGGEDRHRLS
ncbi:MAG TPA: hypothetical protein VGR11_07205 [Solirubrobacteraceae bacterium]|nr:hypothetical protein [Solirubrobacteraceae bacterium]